MTDMMDVIRDAVAAAAQQGHLARQTRYCPATVMSISADETLAEVQVDCDEHMDSFGGDDFAEIGAIGAQVIYPTGVRSGDRVMVMFVPPNGAFVIGRNQGDFEEWTYIGEVDPDGEGLGPEFSDDFDNATGTGDPFTDTHARASFRRLGRYAELRGRVWRTAGTGNNIVQLPDGYWPQNRIIVPVMGGVGGTLGHNAITVTAGGVVTAHEFTPIDEPTGSIFLDGIVYSVDNFEAAEVA